MADKPYYKKPFYEKKPAARAPEPPRQVYREPEHRYSGHRDHHPSQGYPHRKRKGLLGELFDFD